ncbi:hypothetical protein PBAL39_01487 [Pedobacter sp. BAL39]|nr:hypothetical protein PBAL39_01487 [Pedobacter sp. BAL39]
MFLYFKTYLLVIKMRIAHIIIIHKNMAQLDRLIESLRHPESDFYVHVDAKVPASEFQHLLKLPQVTFLDHRIQCNWGGFSILKAIFNVIDAVVNSGKEYGFINLMSGQDYPIQSTQHIYDFMLSHQGKTFISYETSSDSHWWKKAFHRYEKYHLTDFKMKGKYLIERVLNKITPARKFPGYTTLYGGNKSTWWTIDWECAVHINKVFQEDTKLQNFLKLCWGTDEFVIPTLIMNSPFKKNVINNSLRYIDWSEGNASPKVLGIGDFNTIQKSGMLYARKFDQDIDAAILNKIDGAILSVTQPTDINH